MHKRQQKAPLQIDVKSKFNKYTFCAYTDFDAPAGTNQRVSMTLASSSSMCSNIGPPKALSYFTASFSVFLIILTIPGNFLICLAIIKDPFRNLKTPFNYFLLSLATTDLVVGTIMDPVSVAFHTSEGLQLNIVDIKILHILYFILCTASILILMALTVDRYLAV